MNDFESTLCKTAGIFLCLCVLCITILLILTAGCVTGAKNAYNGVMDITPTTVPTTPQPTTATVEETVTPTPEPIYDYSYCDPLQECYYLREFKTYFRHDANNFGEDLRTSVTVYGYRFMPFYHYWSISWARAMRESPPDGKQFLFVFVNTYSDQETKATQYGFKQNHFALQVKNRTYYPDDVWYPERRITEFDDVQNYNRVGSITPYGYTIVQDAGTGIIRADEQIMLYPGRSNAWDGWIRFTIPAEDKDTRDMRVHANLANIGGRANWVLREK